MLEKLMSQSSGTTLRCNSPSLDQMEWVSEECWLTCDNETLIQWTQQGDASEEMQELARYIHRDDTCYMLIPSWFHRALSEREGWEWFDPIRQSPRYRSYVDRLAALIVTRRKQI